MALSPAALETYVEHYRRDRHREAEQAALVALARRVTMLSTTRRKNRE
jgi:hypothetical protein